MQKQLDRQIFFKGLQVLSVLPQGKNPVDLTDEFTLTVWYEALGDIDNDSFQKAVILLLRSSKWHPAPVDIRRAAGFIETTESGKSDETAITQWEEFSRKIQSVGHQRMERIWYEDKKAVFDDPVTDAIARTFAKEYAMSNVTEAGNWRARFIAAYNNSKEHGIKTAEVQKIGNILSGMIGQSGNLKLVKP
ncbi:MAG: hypothetical protein AB7F25_06960 [Deferribacterales bacterium]